MESAKQKRDGNRRQCGTPHKFCLGSRLRGRSRLFRGSFLRCRPRHHGLGLPYLAFISDPTPYTQNEDTAETPVPPSVSVKSKQTNESMWEDRHCWDKFGKWFGREFPCSLAMTLPLARHKMSRFSNINNISAYTTTTSCCRCCCPTFTWIAQMLPTCLTLIG